ncbi:hypothetical protein CDN97_23405 [Pantoea sp. AMG 501]|nr:hypothetical protein CDN97_23405 [Pantoea sp. AMG 501]
MLVSHYGGLIAQEVVLDAVMFLNVQDSLCVSDTVEREALSGLLPLQQCQDRRVIKAAEPRCFVKKSLHY